MGVKYLDSTTSTNEYIKQNPSSFYHLDAVYTMCQTNGRGRMGRNWSAEGGIALSIFVGDANNPMLIPLCAAIAVYNSLEKSGVNNLGIKWPNDILVDGKKLCGILCEGVIGGYIVGIGVNNKQTNNYFENADLPYATSMKILGYNPLCEEMFVELCIKELEKALKLSSEELVSLFTDKCVNLGKMVKIIKNDSEIIAKAVDVSIDGGLVVECEGQKQTIISGEVSVKGIYGYGE